MIGSTSENLTKIGEKAIASAPKIRMKNGLILYLSKDFFGFFFFDYKQFFNVFTDNFGLYKPIMEPFLNKLLITILAQQDYFDISI